jgi:predicted transcriptional regulator
MTASQAMIPSGKLVSTLADAEVWATVENMGRSGVNQLSVVEDGRIMGVFSRDDLVRYLGILQSLRMQAAWPAIGRVSHGFVARTRAGTI